MDAEFARHRDIIAMEASILSVDPAELLGRVFPGVVEGFTSLISRFLPSDKPIQLTSKQSNFLKDLEKIPYVDLRPVTAYVPEGLAVSYPDYCSVLRQATNYAVEAPARLNQYITYVEVLLTNRDQKYDTKSNQRTYRKMDDMRSELLTAMGSCYNNGSTRTQVTYGDVIDRHSDWPALFHDIAEVNKSINSVDRAKLKKQLQHAVELLNRVMAMHGRGELEGLSSPVLLELSEGAYQVAAELELFSVVYYRVAGLTTAVDHTVKNLTEILDR